MKSTLFTGEKGIFIIFKVGYFWFYWKVFDIQAMILLKLGDVHELSNARKWVGGWPKHYYSNTGSVGH